MFYSLAIPRMLLDTPVPWSVLEALAPAAWRRRLITGQLRSAGLFDPDARKFSNPAYMLFNALLYDDLGGLWRAVVPDADWMRQRYDIAHDAVLPAYHLRRWADLLWRRSL